MHNDESLRNRLSPLAMSSEEFRKLGTQLIDRIARLLDSLPERPVTPAESPAEVRQALAAHCTLPQPGADPAQLLDHAASLLFDHSLFNGHPRFWGYITSSAAPYLSNAVVHGKFALRACIVNFRTSLADIEALLPIVVRIGRALNLELRPDSSQTESSQASAFALLILKRPCGDIAVGLYRMSTLSGYNQ